MPAPDVAPTAPRSTYLGILLLAASVIVFQIALTRVFALMMWHHLTYMVVSIALLGFGAAGSLLTARRAATEPGPAARRLARQAALYGFSVMLALCFVTTIEVDSLSLWQEKRNFFALLLIYLIITVPFLLGGIAIGTALTRYARQVNKVYFADLIGSALGGGASVLLLQGAGSGEVVFLAGALGVVAAFVFAFGAGTRTVLRHVPALVVAAFVALAFAGGVPALGVPEARWPIPFAPNKEVKRLDLAYLDARLPSPTAEVEVSVHFDAVPPTMGGNFGVVDATKVGQRVVAQDGTAPTIMIEGAAHLERFPFLDDTSAGTAYHAFEARGGVAPEVLVIGVGGGVDVMVALHHRAARVDAVEINTAMIEMVRERYDEYLAGLFRPGAHPWSDRVRLVNGEGRSFMRHQDHRYDVIQMSGVDSFTALSTGAYTLSESYLYTVEAVKEFYAHLAEGGYVNYSRFLLTYPRKPRETLRLANIAYTALAELGVADPAAQIAVFAGHNWASTMIKRGAFTPLEIAALQEFAEREGFRGFVYDPLKRGGEPFPPPADTLHLARLLFQDRVLRFGLAGPENGAAGMVDGLVDAFAASLAGDADRARATLDAIGAPADLLAAAVAEAGQRSAPFLAVRQDFETLLRGSPDVRRAFVDAYEYDVTPCTDDTPFFFNYYRYRGLLGRGAEDLDEQSHYHYDYPVGHAVLLASLGQIVVIAFVLLILPLRVLRRAGVPTPGKLRYFLYFAALGMGFMFVEIVLMQKMVIFLGHPTYALSVVLTGLLGFAGVGSWLSGRIQSLRRANLLKLMLAVVAAVLLLVPAVNLILPELIGLPFAARVAIVLVMLVPVGLALGMPFPTGIRLLERNAPDLMPWAWAVNGFLSVFSSIFCIVLAMAFGFTTVLLLAALVYAIGFLAVPAARLEPSAV